MEYAFALTLIAAMDACVLALGCVQTEYSRQEDWTVKGRAKSQRNTSARLVSNFLPVRAPPNGAWFTKRCGGSWAVAAAAGRICLFAFRRMHFLRSARSRTCICDIPVSIMHKTGPFTIAVVIM